MKNASILIKIRKIVRSINLESKKIQSEYGISIPQLLLLGYLNESPGFQRSAKEASTFLELNPSTMTGIIDRMEKKGFIARLPKMSEDKRSTIITLTSKGSKLYNAAPSLLQERLSDKLGALSKDKIIIINQALDTIIQALEIDNIDASPLLTIEDNLNEAE